MVELEDSCPDCDELIKINVTDDYYMKPSEEVFSVVKCPECDSPISIEWYVAHRFTLRRADELSEAQLKGAKW